MKKLIYSHQAHKKQQTERKQNADGNTKHLSWNKFKNIFASCFRMNIIPNAWIMIFIQT